MSSPELDDVAAIEELRKAHEAVLAEMSKAIHGQKDVIEKLMIAIFARGHALLMGVPGLAKTLMVQSLSKTMHLDFSRIQFTPDLMPSDITGTDILQESLEHPGRREFHFIKGPIFANIVLADEINRTSAKTQAALLEAMQEHKVTVVGRTYPLPPPFFVLATQNPIEQEGTYPLPEAQLDRFMFFIEVSYPSREDELAIARRPTGSEKPNLKPVLSGEDIMRYQELVRRLPVPDHIYDYVVDLVRGTRPNEAGAKEWVKQLVAWGAGPRAVQNIILASKARAALHGSYMVRMDDIDAVVESVLVHRIQLTFQAESEGMSARDLVRRLLKESGRT